MPEVPGSNPGLALQQSQIKPARTALSNACTLFHINMVFEKMENKKWKMIVLPSRSQKGITKIICKAFKHCTDLHTLWKRARAPVTSSRQKLTIGITGKWNYMAYEDGARQVKVPDRQG